MKKFHITIFFVALAAVQLRAEKPRLVVNIIVSQMRYDYLARFGPGFVDGGFRRLTNKGMLFTDAQYALASTNTPATLATLFTGGCPDVHGVVGPQWIDYSNNRTVNLIEDSRYAQLEGDGGRYSPLNLVVPNTGERLRSENAKCKVVSIAIDPLSAIVMGGHGRDVYWLDRSRALWTSSTACMLSLPQWVARYNHDRYGERLVDWRWTPARRLDRYANREAKAIDLSDQRPTPRLKVPTSGEYEAIALKPCGNTLVKEFAKQAIIYEDLGRDEHTDLLNICFDTPRYIGERYGSGSMEIEDTFYRLDEDLAEFIDFVAAQIPLKNVLFILTSDHGACDAAASTEAAAPEQFNGDMFRLLVNGFLSAQYGAGEWAVGFIDGQLYLNRDLILSRSLQLGEVQSRVASFALQFRGISHTVTATALANSYFGGGYIGRMQRSYYPKRSGDVAVNLMPGWVYERPGVISQSGSLYDYDTHVPLIFFGSTIQHFTIADRIDMCAVAPTLSAILGVGRPFICETPAIAQVVAQYR
ncbi:MAG: alkaline phosphatase family protein [Rikenellaceae bacterium]|jgi:predicted AlkP superfamily pyrophosphatase or phosphodiesterase|nr:alkaline phosphatase family protein [Rikenellaceae bacterium]